MAIEDMNYSVEVFTALRNEVPALVRTTRLADAQLSFDAAVAQARQGVLRRFDGPRLLALGWGPGGFGGDTLYPPDAVSNTATWRSSSPIAELFKTLSQGQNANFTSSNREGKGWWGIVTPEGMKTIWCEGEESGQRYSIDAAADVLCALLAGQDPGRYRTLDSSLHGC